MLSKLLGFTVLSVLVFTAGCRSGNRAATNASPSPSAADDVWQDARLIDFRPSTVSISVLKNWNFSSAGHEVTMTSPGQTLTVIIFAPPFDTFDAAEAKSIEQVARFVDRAEPDATPQKWNVESGLFAISEKGIGTKDGAKVGWGSALVNTGAKPLQLVWYFEPSSPNRDEELHQLQLMLNNIRTLTNAKRSVNTYIID